MTNYFHKVHGVRALIIKDSKILLLRRSDTDENDAGLWDLPGGSIEDGENIVEALKREVLEETGLAPDRCQIATLLGFVAGSEDFASRLSVAIYLCQSSTKSIVLNDEHTDHCWVSLGCFSQYPPGRILKAIKEYLPELIV